MILFLEDKLCISSRLNFAMFVGFVKDGMNNYLNLKFLNRNKMEKTMSTFISTFKNLSQG